MELKDEELAKVAGGGEIFTNESISIYCLQGNDGLTLVKELGNGNIHSYSSVAEAKQAWNVE